MTDLGSRRSLDAAGSEGARKNVMVAGDVTMAWNIAQIERAPDDGLTWNLHDKAEIYYESGGAVLVTNLLKSVFAGYRPGGHPVHVYDDSTFVEPHLHDEDGYHHSYSVWSRHRRTKAAADTAEAIWRMDQFLGFHGDLDSKDRGPRESSDEHLVPDLIVLADTNLGFRDAESRWPEEIRNPRSGSSRPWVLLKTGAPLLGGSLWPRLRDSDPERLVVLTTLSEVRLSGVRPKRLLSWEGLAYEVLDQILRHPVLHELDACAYVVISIGTGGAIVLSRAPGQRNGPWGSLPTCSIVFDPNQLGNSWVDDHPGRMIGYATCVTAGLARELMGGEVDEREIIRGVRRGLMASRVLHLSGLASAPREPSASAPGVKLRFPDEQVAAEVNRDPQVADKERPKEAAADFPQVRIGRDENWTILQSLYPDDSGPIAEAVVRIGVDSALKGVPVGRFGDLVTVDRGEIEGLRGIRDALHDYPTMPSKRPFCFSVFGPPGAGKSFAVESVARAALDPGSYEWLPFNLSQMQGRAELVDALHRVRDCGLRGKLPFVFWDEFDGQLGDDDLGWLQHFLAPMQDGMFFDRQIEHPLGNAIFAFAGGINWTRRQFDLSQDPLETRRQWFRGRKGPDFVSRLKGNVDIVGINPLRSSGTSGEHTAPNTDPETPPDSDDEAPDYGSQAAGAPAAPRQNASYRIRRAILLRAILLKDWPSLFEQKDGITQLNIDGRVLRAFLRVSKYKYGARSLESIVAMSALSGKSSFDRAALPDGDQLQTHVSSDFLDRAQDYMPQGTVHEDLARAVHRHRGHELATRGLKRYLADHLLIPPLRGVDRGGDPQPEEIDYDDLDPRFKEQNLTFAQDVPKKAYRLGFWIQRPSSAAKLVVPDLSQPGWSAKVEDFARFEHRLWHDGRKRSGWCPGDELDVVRLEHPHVKEWDRLIPEQRELDRALATELCEVVNDASLVLVEPRIGTAGSPDKVPD
jgi:hypothetical protein